jgi:hypothetical protein
MKLSINSQLSTLNSSSIATCIAGNVAPIEQGNEWLQISPFGEFPHPDGLQKFQRANAEKMVAEFNSLAGRMARLFRGLPVFAGHPDVDPESYPDDRRLGKITALEVRDDGLYGKVQWNNLGEENLREGYRPFPSPAWRAPRRTDGTIDPVELISVGLTNSPNIRGVQPWTNEDNKTKTTSNMPPWLLELLGLPADATEEQIRSAVTAKLSAANNAGEMEQKKKEAETAAQNAQTRITELEGKFTTANAATKAAQNAHAKTLLDAAVADGRITAAERATHETAFNSDFGAASTALATLKPKLNTKEIEIAGTRVEISNAEARKRVIDEAVSAHMAKHNCDFNIAWNAVKNDPRYAQVFAAMRQPKGAACK